METIFEIGEEVIGTGSYMHQITKGKHYRVTDYQPKQYTETFTWPTYVTVIGDLGKPVTAHTHRFKKLGD